ncbi:hypothetical protein DID78_05635 [Candidatus Marinamargulisbacteria bacterium SCGC AG-343-D04]|nr:hypothetical protein DID78_05635 [Candidatus Marinamargulisbacteria bacterium SCGC AG-343-D04]
MSQNLKKLFIAATRQNDGKTMTSLGLFNAICKRFSSVAYMKPVGQQYVHVEDKKVDKDAFLFQRVYDLKDDFDYMSPIAVSKGFTQEYIDKPSKEKYQRVLNHAYDSLVENKDFLLVEGTGHAGVGSVFDLSNADVSKLFKTKVILVSLGGIGRSIDEILLNKAVFDLQGVELMGVIINKIQQEKYDKVSYYIKKSLEDKGIPVFGCIPFVQMLNNPTIETVFEKIGGKLLSSKVGYSNKVEKCVVGDMVPHDALTSLEPNSLFIVPANREGLIMAALCGNLLDSDVVFYVSGIIFTGGKEPHDRVLDLIKRTHIPLMLVQEDSFNIATKITNMLVKVGVNESEKIHKIQDLVEEYVDVDGICERL